MGKPARRRVKAAKALKAGAGAGAGGGGGAAGAAGGAEAETPVAAAHAAHQRRREGRRVKFLGRLREAQEAALRPQGGAPKRKVRRRQGDDAPLPEAAPE